MSDVVSQRLGRGFIVFGAIGLASLVGVGCGSKSGSPTEETNLATLGGGFAVAMIAADYSSSKLYIQSLKDGEPEGDLKPLLTGESGIPWTKSLDGKLFFFNRSTTSSNFRTLDPKAADGAPSPQVRTDKAGVGDPHDALLLPGGRLLLAHYSAGKLVVVNVADGSLNQEIDGAWDLGTGTSGTAPFRPEALYQASKDKQDEIYVLHQARNADFSGYTGTQQLFILKDNGVTLDPIDLDPAKEKIQGIKLNIFNPQIIDGSEDPLKPIIAGFCTILDKPTPPCTSGFEQVDLAARTSSLVFERTTSAEKGNGNVVASRGGLYYAAMATVDAAGFKNKIQEFDTKSKTVRTFYEIADSNYAAYALGYDPKDQKLYVGEKKPDASGQFTVFDLKNPQPKDQVTAPAGTIALPLPPAEITFFP